MNWNSIMNKYAQVFILTLVLLTSQLTGNVTNAAAQAGTVPLLGDAVGASSQDAGDSPAYIARMRMVSMNTSMLFDLNGAALDPANLPAISLNLFPDATFTGIVSQVQRSPSQTVWFGNLMDFPGSYFYIVSTSGAFIAHIASTKGVYEISTAGDNLYKVVQIDQSKLGDDAPGKMAVGSQITTQSADVSATADSGAVIDILVVYTKAARIAEGSTAAMNARIALAVAQTNQAYSNAGIITRLRLVHTEEVAYNETGNISTDLNRLVSPSDGYLDNVQTLRNVYGADMVSLIVNNGGSYCGIADAILASSSTAFQVTVRPGCMTGYYSFGHEFAHLQGARHDPYVDATTSPYAYGHGYVNLAGKWRTIMAYNNRCANSGVYCTRLQYFSNPTKQYNSYPLGVSGVSENYKVLNTTAFTVANFRATVMGPNFSSPFTTNSIGWIPITGTWGLASSNYFFTTGLPGLMASVAHSGNYGDITFTVRMKRESTNNTLLSNLIIRGVSSVRTTRGEWRPGYIFSYTNSGMFSVQKFNSLGILTTIKPLTSTTSIVKNDWNILKVLANGTELKFYINNVLVYSGLDSTLRIGQVGIGMNRDTASTNNGLYVDSAILFNSPTAN